MSTAAIVAGTIGAVGSIGSAAIGSSAAGNAASTQANAALQAAQLQHQDAQAALGFQQNVFNTQQQELAPWLGTGQAGLANLSYQLGLPVNGNFYLPGNAPAVNAAAPGSQGGFSGFPSGANIMGVPLSTNGGDVIRGNNQPQGTAMGGKNQGIPLASLINPNLGAQGSLLQPFGEKFQAPTDVTEQNDPGYQFRLQQGMRALDASAASRGNILSGGTAKAAQRYGQDYASNEYNNVYNRAFNEYATRYNQYEQQQANTYNRLASVAGVGQTAANQLGYLGQNAAGNVGNILMSSGQQIGNSLQNAAYQQASGYTAGAGAWQGALNNLGGLAMMYGPALAQSQIANGMPTTSGPQLANLINGAFPLPG